MTALVFVDTNVFIYSFDERDAAKQQRAQVWLRWCWATRSGRISTQVLNELYNNAITKFRNSVSVQQARHEIRNLRQWQPPHLDTYTVEGAWSLQDSHPLSYWDALIVSSAQQQGCNYLLSEDLQHGQRMDSLTIVNPFIQSPSDLGLAN